MIKRWLALFGAWLVEWATRDSTVVVDVDRDAVQWAYGRVGLPAEQFSPDYDLKNSGKIYDVLHLAAQRLGKDHELRTVQDVVDWLKEAPDGGRR